jgi:hypothetical protein
MLRTHRYGCKNVVLIRFTGWLALLAIVIAVHCHQVYNLRILAEFLER